MAEIRPFSDRTQPQIAENAHWETAFFSDGRSLHSTENIPAFEFGLNLN